MISRLAPLGLSCLLLGCAGDPSSTGDRSASRDPRTAAETRALEDEPGLLIERLRILPGQPSPDPILATIEPLESDLDGAPGFRRQGFLAMIVSEEDLGRLEAGLAPTAFAGRTWHGEAMGWRSAASRRLPNGSAMLMEGRSRRLSQQIVSLAVRGWSIPTLDGARLQVELVPHLAGNRLNLLEAPRQLGELRGTTIAEVLTCTLDQDECLLVVSIDDLTPGPKDAGDTDDPKKSGDGPFDGPLVPLPPTAAGWLLDDPISRDRGVLLIHGRPHPAFIPPNEGG